MLRHVSLNASQWKEKAASHTEPFAPSVFHSLDVHSQKTVFIYYPPIRRVFTSLLPPANPSHIKKKKRLAMCTATFFHPIPKRLLPYPGPNVSQTSEPKVVFAKPTLCETNLPEFIMV